MATANQPGTPAPLPGGGIQVVRLPGPVDVAVLVRLAKQQAKTGVAVSPDAPALFLVTVPAIAAVTCDTVQAAVGNLPALCGNRIIKVGEAWDIFYHGVAIRGIKDVLGMAYIRFLLVHEGRWFDMLELSGYVEPPPALDPNNPLGKMSLEKQAKTGIQLQDRPDRAIPLLDSTAHKQLIQAKKEIEEDLEIMKAHSNECRQQAEELVAKLKKINNALSYYGNECTFSSDTGEKERKLITKLIRETIRERIARRHESLGRHLEAFINTGYDLSYIPDEPQHWQTNVDFKSPLHK